jgi:hypothetical protein
MVSIRVSQVSTIHTAVWLFVAQNSLHFFLQEFKLQCYENSHIKAADFALYTYVF